MPVFRLSKWILALSIPALSCIGDALFGISSVANAIYQRALLMALAIPYFLCSKPSSCQRCEEGDFNSHETAIKTLLVQNAQLHYDNKRLHSDKLKHSKLTLGQSNSWHAGSRRDV